MTGSSSTVFCYADLHYANLNNVNFYNASIDYTDLSTANLTHSLLPSADGRK